MSTRPKPCELFGTYDLDALLDRVGESIWRSMQRNHGSPECDEPRCSCCRRNGWMARLHRDYGSGGPWRCDSTDCMVY